MARTLDDLHSLYHGAPLSLAACASEKWARPGLTTRYGKLADLIERQITDGTWKPGERMPSTGYLAERHDEKKDTVSNALYVLAVRGQLTLENRLILRAATRNNPIFEIFEIGNRYRGLFSRSCRNADR